MLDFIADSEDDLCIPAVDSSTPEFIIEGDPNINPLIKHLFELLGQRLFLEGGEKTNALHHRLTASATTSFAHNYRDGQVAFMESEEILMLLRSLVQENISSSAWSSHIIKATYHALLALPSLVSIDSEKFSLKPEFYHDPRPVYQALAALCLLGGCVEGLRAGGRIEVISTKELGTLVFYDRRSSQAKLILDANPDKVIDVDPSKIRAHPEFQISPDKFPLTKVLN